MAAQTQARGRILVVDDDPKIVNLVRAYLVAAGFDVITAVDGSAAVERAKAMRPRLALPGVAPLRVRTNSRPRSLRRSRPPVRPHLLARP